MYRCFDCGRKFDEPYGYSEETGVVAPDGFRETAYVEECPYCGSEDFNELETCVCCGEAKEYSELFNVDRDIFDFCEDCYEELKTYMTEVSQRFREQNPQCTEDVFLGMVEVYADIER